MSEQELVQGLRKRDRKVQRLLYQKYSPLLFGLTKRYVRNREDAEDVLVEALFKIMTKVDKYSGSGSFEGWMRRVMVNECLMFLRRVHNFNLRVALEDVDAPEPANIVDELAAQEILALLDELPTGYRTVFNLFVLEGYKHREIAEQLGISINTSKSQLILAKKRMQRLLEDRRRSERKAE